MWWLTRPRALLAPCFPAANLRAWRTLNPAWSTKVWSAREVKKLWKDNYPEYIDLWRLYDNFVIV